MGALRLSNTDRTRLEKLVGMLGSSFDGERLNALDMIQRMADAHKAPIHELLLANGGGGTDSSFDRQRAEQAERRAREADLRAQRAEQAARTQRPAEPPPDAPPLPPEWRDRFAEAQDLNGSLHFLTAWEASFTADLITRGTRWPSPKQAVVIVRILEASAFSASSADADWEDTP